MRINGDRRKQDKGVQNIKKEERDSHKVPVVKVIMKHCK
jgi:hypothetical protein